jgi:hypothetical protein
VDQLEEVDGPEARRQKVSRNVKTYVDTVQMLKVSLDAELDCTDRVLALYKDSGTLSNAKKTVLCDSAGRAHSRFMTTNMLMGSVYVTPKSLTTGELLIEDADAAMAECMPVNIKEAITRLGFTTTRGDMPALGTKFKKAYERKYDMAPPCQIDSTTLPSGTVTAKALNQYMESDRDLVEAEIIAYYTKKAERTERAEAIEKAKAEKAEAIEKKRAEKAEAIEKKKAEKAEAIEKKKAEKAEAIEKKKAEKAEATKKRTAEKAVEKAAEVVRKRAKKMGITPNQMTLRSFVVSRP